MTRPSALLPLSVCALLASCASSPDVRTVDAPEVEKREAELWAENEKQRDFQLTLVRIDQAIESYVMNLSNRGDPRADAQVEQLGKMLRETVIDTGGRGLTSRDPKKDPGHNLRQLKALAADGSEPDRQAIALAALGFSGKSEVLEVMVNGAMLDDPYVADHAVLGLAVLRAPETPPGVLASIVEDAMHPEDGRVQAAWALYQVQTAKTDQSEIVRIWRRFLGPTHDELPPGVLVQAIRGLGYTADAANADLVTPMLKHPLPRIRMSAALALGRMNAKDSWRDLLALLKPQETVQNVRLHARKALARLAGDEDYGYDVEAWQKVFDRGN